MIARLFTKSRPINYVFISLLLVIFYFLYQTQSLSWTNSYAGVVQKALVFLVLVASVFLVRFITKKNGLSKDNSFAALLFVVFLVLFPTTMNNVNIIMANFFVLLAMRRLISMSSLITPKEKIFDASLWIFAAALFHFWAILYLILVFISIIFHVSRDYRNWIIPFIAFFAVTVLFAVAVTLDPFLIDFIRDKMRVSYNFTYFENIYQNIALAIFTAVAVFFFVSQVLTLPNRPLNMQASFKKVYFAFIIGVAIYVLSNHKNNSFLMFTFFPMAVLGANLLETQEVTWVKETVLVGLMLIAIVIFMLQL